VIMLFSWLVRQASFRVGSRLSYRSRAAQLEKGKVSAVDAIVQRW
jgi:hypothetical protein